MEEEKDLENEELVSSNFKLTASLEYKNGLILKLFSQNGYISGLSFEQAIMPIICDKKNEI